MTPHVLRSIVRRKSRVACRRWLVVAVGIIAIAALMVFTNTAHAQTTVLDNTQDAYRTTTRTWLGPISAIARRLFVSLAVIEVSLSGALWTLRREALDEVAGRFLLKFILLSFVLMLITSAGYWMPVIVNSLSRAGQVAGIAPVPAGPSEIVDIGTTIAFFNIDTRGLGLSNVLARGATLPASKNICARTRPRLASSSPRTAATP